jgi:CO/xanthine dehydrogenase Mo-binding subunit
VESIAGRPYAIPNSRTAHVPLPSPTVVGFWRLVEHLMNGFLHESFLDKMVDASRQDPYAQQLLAYRLRQEALLQTVAEHAGGTVCSRRLTTSGTLLA